MRDRNVEEERLKHWFEEEGEMSEENFYSVVREELFRKLRELIDRLPEERKKIMLMSLEGKSGEEIACDLNITIHTVKQQKYRAYKFLREQLGQYTSLLFIFFFLKKIQENSKERRVEILLPEGSASGGINPIGLCGLSAD